MELPLVIVLFFILHWQISVFFQSFFLHRYASHRMFTMSPGWERFFHLCTYFAQGSSYLHPHGYAVLHRMHHAYSDTEKDPHSPVQFSNPLTMMWHTRNIYSAVVKGEAQIEKRFLAQTPAWRRLDDWGMTHWSSALWVGAYTAFYVVFATQWWHYLLIPVHALMGPIHGAIVNWFGHWAGYRNFKTADASRNTLPIDFLTAGELFQNNHHTYASSANFGQRWFELDPTYPAIVLFDKLGIIRLRNQRRNADQALPAPANASASRAPEGSDQALGTPSQPVPAE